MVAPTSGGSNARPRAPSTDAAAAQQTDPPPTASPAGGTRALTTAPEAEAFVRSYYDAVTAGDYETTWPQLAPEFQSGKALSYDYYVEFWNENDIEVGDINLIEANQEQAIVNVELRWNGGSTAVTDQFTLRTGQDGELLVASQSTIDGD